MVRVFKEYRFNKSVAFINNSFQNVGRGALFAARMPLSNYIILINSRNHSAPRRRTLRHPSTVINSSARIVLKRELSFRPQSPEGWKLDEKMRDLDRTCLGRVIENF
ncbi:hypothetical protein TNIN_22921 [Trichonephila inaurata madagascariensis]|uniref:Uncharacterized protein n=1 Tax=Trichonephila inaurata madagascariensis TaxID=2747483 RepID=A0A8X6X900_9ARAC|nr:hypothetical protein TNIN_22921 [Trichonephila inaurata madagascariensis]